VNALLPANLVIAALGPLAELFGVGVLIAAFTLLRTQAHRRSYFNTWERSWVMFGVALAAGVVYQRLTDLNSVLYASNAYTPWLFGFLDIAFRLVSLALLVAGARLFTSGARDHWYVRGAAPLALVLSLIPGALGPDLGAPGLVHGAFAVAAYAYAGRLFVALPESRRTPGSRIAAMALAALAAYWAALWVSYVALATGAAAASEPGIVRLDRYAFYGDLVLQLALAYAMVRLLFEDGKREAFDTREHLALMQDRDRLPELYDDQTGLVNRRGFDASVALAFASASFGSVLRVRLTNLESVITAHGAAMGDTLLKHFAGVLASAVREHDRVFRWDNRDFLVVMPRAVPMVAAARVQALIERAAPLAITGMHETIRPEAIVAVAPYAGGEDLATAVRHVSDDPRLRRAS
jgi:diguanylate cyclase (GGDEF)-like protein